jgi:carbon-monoxide dehydrogenase medium subunit
MKPAVFDYARPATLDEACAMLAAEDDVRIIAGGQTLVPLMAMRLARPKRLIDIARIADLAFIRNEGDAVAIGATTRQCVLEHDPIVRAELPLLAKVMPFVGHAPTRARGTIGGSLANADPAAEMALVAVTLGATLCWREGPTTAEMPAADFFIGTMTTALPAAACLTAVRFPVWREERVGTGFHEVNARRSDFAFASAAAQIALDENGLCRRVALGIGAVTPFPLRLDAAAKALAGTRAEEATVRAAVRAALADLEPKVGPKIEILSDPHASADYRRRVAVTLAVRAVADAYQAAASLRVHGHEHAG